MNILESYKNVSIILVKGNIIFVRDIVLQYFAFRIKSMVIHCELLLPTSDSAVP